MQVVPGFPWNEKSLLMQAGIIRKNPVFLYKWNMDLIDIIPLPFEQAAAFRDIRLAALLEAPRRSAPAMPLSLQNRCRFSKSDCAPAGCGLPAKTTPLLVSPAWRLAWAIEKNIRALSGAYLSHLRFVDRVYRVRYWQRYWIGPTNTMSRSPWPSLQPTPPRWRFTSRPDSTFSAASPGTQRWNGLQRWNRQSLITAV